jgi:glycosyltransferase involved in cell wall biosynthesis
VSSLFAEFSGPSMRVTRALMRFTYPWADQIVAVSQGVAEDLMRHIPLARERVATIYNPVVDERMRDLAQATPVHPWLCSGPVPVVLGVGRLIAQKDFATLIDAFAQLRRQRKLRLLILGEGELRASLLAQAAQLGVAEDVALPGFEANPFAAMRAASVFVLSSRFEGLPGVLIQAMACGARVVSTDCPSGPREVLEDGRWGALVPVGDARALAAAIAQTLDAPRPPKARERAAAFTERQAIERYAQVLGLQEPS